MAPCRVGLDTGVLRPRRGHQGRSASSASDPVMLFGLVRGSLGWILMMPAPGAHAESALVTSICLLGLGFLTWVGGWVRDPRWGASGVPRHLPCSSGSPAQGAQRQFPKTCPAAVASKASCRKCIYWRRYHFWQHEHIL